MVILGIDPGVAITGWAFLKRVKAKSNKIEVLAFGSIKTDKDSEFSQRLLELNQDLSALIKEFKPDYACIEELFFSSNVKTAIDVAQARGVIIMTLEKAGIKLRMVNPRTLKKEVVGQANATKDQVKFMISKILDIKNAPKLDDVNDALAIAYYGLSVIDVKA